MRFPRASGILLHISSLPGPHGIGDMGDHAFEFVDLLAEAGQAYWQILPLTPAGAGNSPYSSYSAFAGNKLLISPERLVADGVLDRIEVSDFPSFDEAAVDFDGAWQWKGPLLEAAFERFRSSPNKEIAEDFERFAAENAWWLEDYVLFTALKDAFGGKPWFEWPTPIRARDAESVERAHRQYAREMDQERFAQFLFFRQWNALKRYANAHGVRILGDIPIFVALDSADVWCNQRLFKLDGNGLPLVVAGVPPDYFSETGQLWGNPIYDWAAMFEDDLGWWTARIAFELQRTDIVRLDHFIGFVRNWEVPFGDETAENGEWADVPGEQIFSTLTRRLGDMPLIAEDLGSLTAEVEQLRDRFGFPGMRILQYGFGGDAMNRDLPHNYPRNCVAYTGTHDNDTALGWYHSLTNEHRRHLRSYLGFSGRDINQGMIRCLLASVADTVIIPLQDLLGFGNDGRMNFPGNEDGNWTWRVPGEMLTSGAFDRLHKMCEIFGRSGQR